MKNDNGWLERNWSWTKYLYPALIGVIIFARNSTPYTTPGFWAEDSVHFFGESLELGVSALRSPVYGYHFFLGRLVAFVATFFPVYYTPLFFSWSCLIVAVVACYYFARSGFEWIVKNRAYRIWAGFLMSFGPGTGDLFASLCNMSSALTLLAFLILLEKPFTMSMRKILVLGFLAFSAGQIFLLTPLVIYLWYLTCEKNYLILLGFVFLPVTLINFSGNHEVGTRVGLLNYENIKIIPIILLENFFIRLVEVPFLGARVTGWIMSQSNLIFWLTGIALLIPAHWLIRASKIEKQKLKILFLGFLVMLSSYGVIAIARKYALSQITRGSGDSQWSLRYSFLPAISVFVLWFAVLTEWQSELKTKFKKVVPLILIIMTVHSLFYWRARWWRRPINWTQASAQIQKALDAKRSGQLKDAVVIQNIELFPEYWNQGVFLVRIRPN